MSYEEELEDENEKLRQRVRELENEVAALKLADDMKNPPKYNSSSEYKTKMLSDYFKEIYQKNKKQMHNFAEDVMGI